MLGDTIEKLPDLRKPSNDINTINLALYPYVPRPEQFERVVKNAWQKVHPEVTINFVDYNCYNDDPPDNLDVFAFDCIFLSYFVSKGYLTTIQQYQINRWIDIHNYALSACKNNGQFFAIPYLGCVNVLFYRKNDADLAGASSLNEIYQILGDSTNPDSPQPPQNQGLLIDLTGGTTDSCLYLDAVMEINDKYPRDPILPPANNLEKQALTNLQTLVKMAGHAQASYDDAGRQRVDWFTQGYGRAMIGVTETLGSFPVDQIDEYSLHVMPLAGLRISQTFFADGLGINSKIDPQKLPLALELINLIASHDVVYDSIIADNPGDDPQFLISVRGSVLADLMDVSKRYYDIVSVVLNHVDLPFLIGSASRQWLTDNKSDIRNEILNNVFEGKTFTEDMFDDSEPHPTHKSRPVNLFRRK